MEKIPKKFQIFPAPNYKARKKQKLALTKKIFVVGNGGGGGGGAGERICHGNIFRLGDQMTNCRKYNRNQFFP